MFSKIKEAWVKALLSGTYTQGHHALVVTRRDPDGGEPARTHCCLGVLTELYVKAHPDAPDAFLRPGAFYVLPLEVQEWAGLSGPNPSVAVDPDNPQYSRHTLSGLNDSQGAEGSSCPRSREESGAWTFAEIARVIESGDPQ